MDETKYTIILISGCLAIVFFVLLLLAITSISKNKNLKVENKLRILEKEKQIELLTAIAKAEENQNIKIAGQLHDDIIPLIALASSNINTELTKLEKEGVQLQNIRNEIKAFSMIQESIREIIHEIVPAMFTSFGLLKALEVFIKQMNRGNKSVAEFHNNTIFSGDLPFTIDEQLTIYKICREVLSNLLKHSKYDYLNVSLEEVKENFILLFSHDGIGINNDEINELREVSSGMGLKLLESRLIVLSADLLYSNDEGVSKIRLKIPIKK
ncbi:MAG: ATP-binding protein [Bacteroidia bacterium]